MQAYLGSLASVKKICRVAAASVLLVLVSTKWLPAQSNLRLNDHGSQPANWQRFHDDAAVALAHPRGWHATVDQRLGQIRLEGTGAQTFLMWPLFVRGPVSAELNARILLQLAKSLGTNVHWQDAQQVGGGPVRTSGRSEETEAVAALVWIPSRTGSAGTFYLAATPRGDYPRNERTFAGIANSLQISGRSLPQEKKTAPGSVLYDGRQMTLDEIFRRYSNAILEVEDVIGPDGTVYQVHSGNHFYWVDGQGNIVGTDICTRPDVDFQELLRLP